MIQEIKRIQQKYYMVPQSKQSTPSPLLKQTRSTDISLKMIKVSLQSEEKIQLPVRCPFDYVLTSPKCNNKIQDPYFDSTQVPFYY